MSAVKRAITLGLAFLALGAIDADEVTAGQPYVVEPGDSLSSIAYKFYRDQYQWRLILDANPDKVSADGALVQVGTVLDIPDFGDAQAETGGSGTTRVDATTGRIQIDLVTGNDFKPYTDEELPEGGMAAEIVATAFRDLGYDPVIDYINWPAAYDLTLRGKFAATLPWAPNAERKADFLYSDAFAEDLTFAFWHVDRPHNLEQIDDIKGYRVCRAAGYYNDFIQHLIDSGEIEFSQPKDINDCWRGLMDGTYDFVIQAEYESAAQIAELNATDEIVRSEVAVSSQSYHLIFPRTSSASEELLNEFNQSLRKMAEAGTLNEIVERHLRTFFASFQTPS